MEIGYSEIKKTLLRLDCRTIHTIKKVIEYMLPETKEAFYLHLENFNPQIVIKPAYIVFIEELSTIRGVHPKDPYYHNDDMSRFPKRLNEGKDECHYGLAFEFSDSKAVEEFILKLISIVKGCS